VIHTLMGIGAVIFITIVGFWLRSNHRLRARSRRLTVTEASSNRRFYKRMTRDPEEQYIEGVGYVIGDLSCNYNARSPYIRCAVNPDGLCQDCRHYQSKDE
jgi:hypothetical protein